MLFHSKCLLYGTPLDLGAAIAEYEVKHLTLFKMFEMDICIINRTQSNNKINFGFKKLAQRANFYSDLLTSNKRFYYLQLKSVYMYYLKRYDNAIELNNEAIKLVESSNYKLKKASIKKQLSENEFILKSILREPQHNLYSQIHTTDGLFNLPCM